jgi:hypothetical protein
VLLLSIAKWGDLPNSQSLVNDGDRQAPLDLSNLLPEGTDLDPGIRLTHHKSIPAFPGRKASVSSNRTSFGPKDISKGIRRYVPDPTDLGLPHTHL